MNRHFLLAIDGSAFARKAVKYQTALFQKVPDVEITLFMVAPGAPSYLASPNPAINEIHRQERVEEIERQNYRRAWAQVEEFLHDLEKRGWPRERLHAKVQIKRGDLAYTILREARQGRYDALVVGRRGLGRLASAWMGSVSQKLVTYGQGLPVWVISGKEWSYRFLLAVDIGEAGLKVVDHAGFILSDHPEAEVVLFHVLTGLFSRTEEVALDDVTQLLRDAAQQEAAAFFEEARKMLISAGVSANNVRVKLKTSAFGPAAAIIKEAQKGAYGTVVVGRRGRGGFRELLLGSVSTKVLSHLNQQAIWVVG